MSTDVDHKVPKALFESGVAQGNPDDPTNLQGLCKSCHASKTAREDGGFGNPRRGGVGG